jgi:hypothetical protein
MDKTTREVAMPQEGRPWNCFHTQSYAESYKSRHKKYPIGYDPDNPDPETKPEPAPTNAEFVEEAARAASQTDRRSNRRRLTERCRGYKVNDALANCREISDKVRCTLAIINGLMSNLGYCYGSIEQLAVFMHMSVRGAHHLLDRLCKLGFIVHIGVSGRNIKRVVRPDLSNNPQRTQRFIDEYNREDQ